MRKRALSMRKRGGDVAERPRPHFARVSGAMGDVAAECLACDQPIDAPVHIKPNGLWRACMLRIAGDQIQSRVPVLLFTARDISHATRFDQYPLRGNNVLRALDILGYVDKVPRAKGYRQYRLYRVSLLGWRWLGWRPTQGVRVEQTLVPHASHDDLVEEALGEARVGGSVP